MSGNRGLGKCHFVVILYVHIEEDAENDLTMFFKRMLLIASFNLKPL